MSYIKVKPMVDKMIRNPVNQLPIKKEGERVHNNSFWRRRIADGDVTQMDISKIVSDKKTRPSSPKSKENSHTTE